MGCLTWIRILLFVHLDRLVESSVEETIIKHIMGSWYGLMMVRDRFETSQHKPGIQSREHHTFDPVIQAFHIVDIVQGHMEEFFIRIDSQVSICFADCTRVQHIRNMDIAVPATEVVTPEFSRLCYFRIAPDQAWVGPWWLLLHIRLSQAIRANGEHYESRNVASEQSSRPC